MQGKLENHNFRFGKIKRSHLFFPIRVPNEFSGILFLTTRKVDICDLSINKLTRLTVKLPLMAADSPSILK